MRSVTCITRRRRHGISVLASCISCTREKSSNAAYVLDFVRKHDYEGYLCSSLLPTSSSCRAALAIRAFNLELAQIRETVSAKMIGDMRFQFWKDALSAIYRDHLKENPSSSDVKKKRPLYSTKVPKQPVALELAWAIEQFGISRDYLNELFQARTDLVDEAPFPLASDMEHYCARTFGSIIKIGLEIVARSKDISMPEEALSAASHVGVALGLVNMTRGMPFQMQKYHVFLPDDVMARHETSRTLILRGMRDHRVKACVKDLMDLATTHLHKARELKPCIKNRTLRLGLLPAVVCEHYLRRILDQEFDVFDARLAVQNGRLPFQLYWHRIRGSF